LNLFKIKIVVYGFLTLDTRLGPRHRGKPLRVDVFIAQLASPKAALLDTTERCAGASKLVKFSVKVTNTTAKESRLREARLESLEIGPVHSSSLVPPCCRLCSAPFFWLTMELFRRAANPR
jgi:hypothetical protein